MAEEMQGMQGIMGLQEGQDMGQMEEAGQVDMSLFSPEIEGYARTNPRQFSRDILGGIAEADPALAQQFVAELSTMQLPPEVIDALQLMVDNLLNDPEGYAENRQDLISEGVPEELLPEQFDPAYFAAFNLALDQLDSNRPPEVPGFAGGGIINVKKISKELSAMGRGGDTMLAHITPEEARMLRRQGGSGTINPKTGLPEFGFFKKIFKSVAKVVKGAVKAVKSVVKSVGKVVKKIASSTIGKIALTFAAVYFMGPAGFNVAANLGVANAAAATAVNTFAGSALVNVASGQKVGDALKGAAVSAALAGVTTGITKGFSTQTTPSAPAPVVDKSFNLSGNSLADTATSGVPTPTSVGPSSINAITPSPDVQTFGLPNPDPVVGVSNMGGAQYPNYNNFIRPEVSTAGSGGISNLASGANPVISAPTSVGIESLQAGGSGIGIGSSNPSLQNMYGTPPSPIPSAPIASAPIPSAPTPPGFIESLKKGNFTDAAEAAYRNISPSEIAKANPQAGLIEKYGPLAAVGAGAAYLGGAFKVPEQDMPDNIDQFKTTGADLLAKDPQKYGLSFGGANTTYAGYNPYDRIYGTYNPYATNQAPKQYKAGGEAYPRKIGPINGPGTGTSDSIPAMLSDGEFVFTAKAVRAMGQGSRRKGAKRMYALMKQLEKKG